MDGMHIMIPQEEYMRLMEENEELREALKGAQIIAEQAKGHIAENASLRAELKKKIEEANFYKDGEESINEIYVRETNRLEAELERYREA